MVQSCSPTHLLIEVFSSLTICTGYRVCVPLDKTVLFRLVGKPPIPLARARDERLPGWCDHHAVMGVMFGGDERLFEGNEDVDDNVDLSRERFSQIFVKGPVQLFMFQLVPDINNLDL